MNPSGKLSTEAGQVQRDPCERMISHYHFGLDITRNGKQGLPIELSLTEYLDQITIYSFNCQTAFLSGLHAEHQIRKKPLDRRLYDRGLLERAKRNLESHDVIGLTERFDESLLLLRERYGWPVWRTLYRPKNIGKGRQNAPNFSPDQLEAIRANNELDIELYDFACELFEERLLQLSRADQKLKRFRHLNRTFEWAGQRGLLKRL